LQGEFSFESLAEELSLCLKAIIKLELPVFTGESRQVKANALSGYRVANEAFESIVVGF
jgi:hypothetical protein